MSALAIVVVALLWTFSGVLSLAETAFTRASRIRLLAREEEGDKRARRVLRLLEHPEQTLNSILLLLLGCQMIGATILGTVLEPSLGAAGIAIGIVTEIFVVFTLFEVVPKTFALHTSDGDVMIPVRSVLAPADKLEPAPLVPPRAERYPRMPFVAMAVAALLAMLAWTGVFLLARRRVAQPAIVLNPAEEIRKARDWAGLADAVRRYLAATDPRLGLELTTRELLARCDDRTVAEILRQGDLQKFSPWGAAPGDFDALARRALALIVPEPPAEERAA